MDRRANELRSSEGLPAPGVRQNVGIWERWSGEAPRLRRSVGGGGVGRFLVRLAIGPGLGERRLQNAGLRVAGSHRENSVL